MEISNGIIHLNDEFIDTNKKEEEIENEMRNLLRLMFPDSENISFQILKGGLTNILYLSFIEFKNGGERDIKKMNVRINGQGSEKLIDRTKELEIFESISKFGTGAKLHGTFKNGIVYDYLEGKALTHLEIRQEKHQEGIAKAVARLHKLKPNFTDVSTCFNNFMDSWMEELRKIDFKDPNIKKRMDKISFEELEKESRFLKILTTKYCSSSSSSSQQKIVFSHNDLLGGNIIYNETEKTYKFIDFEYAGMNYRGFDLGDHFTEYTGFECEENDDDNEKEIYRPPKALLLNFLRHYLKEIKKKKKEIIEEEEQEGEEEIIVIEDEELEELYIEAMIGKLLANIMWSVWSFYSHFHKDGFDYFTYGEDRLRVYYREKQFVCKELDIEY